MAASGSFHAQYGCDFLQVEHADRTFVARIGSSRVRYLDGLRRTLLSIMLSLSRKEESSLLSSNTGGCIWPALEQSQSSSDGDQFVVIQSVGLFYQINPVHLPHYVPQTSKTVADMPGVS